METRFGFVLPPEASLIPIFLQTQLLRGIEMGWKLAHGVAPSRMGS